MPDDDAPEGPEPVKLNDLDGQRFANALARPEEPTSALRELFLIERITGVPVGPVPVLVGPAEGGALRAALLSTAGREPVLLAIDPPKAPEAEAPIDVILPVAVARPVNRAFKPTRVNCAPPPEPWVCPPVRLADCPACAAKVGERCVGFDRWDECHAERVGAL